MKTNVLLLLSCILLSQNAKAAIAPPESIPADSVLGEVKIKKFVGILWITPNDRERVIYKSKEKKQPNIDIGSIIEVRSGSLELVIRRHTIKANKGGRFQLNDLNGSPVCLRLRGSTPIEVVDPSGNKMIAGMLDSNETRTAANTYAHSVPADAIAIFILEFAAPPFSNPVQENRSVSPSSP